MTRRLLVISPHFPPDATAAAHRARVVTPYLRDHGWDPVVLTVQPEAETGANDAELEAAISGRAAVERVVPWSRRATRFAGVGDLGLRAAVPLYARARHLCADAVYLTTYPLYPALLLPWLRRRLGVPVVVDLQDPWVGEWGRSVGGGRDGRVDLRSRLSRLAARAIERVVLPQVDAVTSVSSSLLDELAGRYPVLRGRPRLELPIGIDPKDLDRAASAGAAARPSGAGDPLLVRYVGTLLPLGFAVLDVVLDALRTINEAGAGRHLRLDLVGTSNQARADASARAGVAVDRAGAAGWVCERPGRVPYFDALRLLAGADIVLLMGSAEGRYTASKLHAVLASGRPVIAIVHAASDIAQVMAPLAARDAAIALFTFDGERPPATLHGALVDRLRAWLLMLPVRRPDTRFAPGTTGPELAAALARLLDTVCARARDGCRGTRG